MIQKICDPLVKMPFSINIFVHSISIISAPCSAGHYMTETGCQKCGENTYSEDGASSCTSCPDGKVSNAGSSSIEDCYYGTH